MLVVTAVALCTLAPPQAAAAPPEQGAEVRIERFGLGNAEDGYRVQLNLNRSDDLGAPFQIGPDARRDRLSFDAEAVVPDFKIKLKGDFTDLGHQPGELPPEFRFIEGDDWERNRVAETTISLSAYDDALRFTSRHAHSSYDASDQYLRDLARKNNDRSNAGKERFLHRRETQGEATLQRLDLRVWKSDRFELSAFASHAEVDRFFEPLRRTEKKRDVFASPDRKTTRFGGTIRLGPLSASLARADLETADGGGDWSEGRHEAYLEFRPGDLRQLTGDLLGETFWALSPGAVWLSLGRGTVDPAGGFRDATDDLSFGASWSWDGGHANLGYWRSFYDTRQPGAEEYDWRGSGIDGGIGFYGDRWSLDLSASYYLSEDLGPASRAVDAGYDGSIFAVYRPDGFPDLSFGVNLGRYESDSIWYRGRFLAWDATAMLDFGKFLDVLRGPARPSLKLLYQNRGQIDRDDAGGSAARNENIVAVAFRMRF